MKILICTGIYPPDIGGPATYSKLLFDELPKRGIEVEVLSFGEVRHLPKIFRHLAYFIWTLKKGLEADLIYAQDPVSVGLPSVLVAKILRKKFWIRIAGDFAWEQFQNQKSKIKNQNVIQNEKFIGIEEFQNMRFGFITELRKKIERFVAKNADQIIVPSNYFKKIIVLWRVNTEKIKVIYNGIDLNFEKSWESHSQQKEKTLLSVGRLVPWKGFKQLIQMIPDIQKEIPDLKLKIIGDGPQKEELAKEIQKLGLKNSVFLLGKLSREDLLKEKQKAGIFVFNTNWESFSFDTVEAMALGLPVITTNICSLPELIEDGKEGILVEPNNKEQFLNAILKVLKDENFRNEIIKNAKQKSQMFSIKNTLDKLEKLLMK